MLCGGTCGSFSLGDFENDSVKLGLRGEVDSLFVSRQRLVEATRSSQAVATGREKDGAFFGAGHALEISHFLFFPGCHRIGPCPVIVVVMADHSESRDINIETRLLIFPADEEMALRAYEGEWVFQPPTDGDVESGQ